jgi:hypothetical protein
MSLIGTFPSIAGVTRDARSDVLFGPTCVFDCRPAGTGMDFAFVRLTNALLG